jgi:hypothetical protein
MDRPLPLPPSKPSQPTAGESSSPRPNLLVDKSSCDGAHSGVSPSTLNPAASPFSPTPNPQEASEELSDWLLFSPSSSEGRSSAHGSGRSASPSISFVERSRHCKWTVAHRMRAPPLWSQPGCPEQLHGQCPRVVSRDIILLSCGVSHLSKMGGKWSYGTSSGVG